MDKIEYITSQFSRAEKKRYEHYVVTRIWHLLNDLTLKFTTQQYVIISSGRAMTDMYFPQLGIHIEVDESYHLNQKEQDQLRQVDIVNATNHQVERIDISKGIENVNRRIDEVIETIREAKLNASNFKKWDLQAEQNPQTYIDKGSINITDDIAFEHSYLAANCFGHSYNGFQKGITKHPREDNKQIWFPKLYSNGTWNNSISDDENTIIEKSVDSDITKRQIDRILINNQFIRIVFARVKSPLGDVMYRFKGEFQFDKENTSYKTGIVWRKISNEVKTYRPKNEAKV